MRGSNLLAVLLVIQPVRALAIDGKAEINQACATAGCFPGDEPGFPVSITGAAGRSYVLTSDLLVSDPNSGAILIQGDGVTLDLGGFEIRGPNSCTGSPPACVLSGGVPGVWSRSRNTEVRNGSISGIASHALNLGGADVLTTNQRVRDVRVSHSSEGMIAGERSLITGCLATQNGGVGIQVGNFSTVSENVSTFNAGSGFYIEQGSTIAGNTAGSNGGAGFICGTFSTVTGNTASENNWDGIRADHGSTVSNNTATLNGKSGIRAGDGCVVTGNTVFQNDRYGIEALRGVLIERNSIRANSLFGAVLGEESAFRANLVTSAPSCNVPTQQSAISTTGCTVLGGIDLGANSCDGRGTCP